MAKDGWEDVPMFEVQARYKRRRPPPQGIGWRAYKGKRVPCELCVLEIAKGVRASLADPARHVRTEKEKERFLCDRHAREVRDGC